MFLQYCRRFRGFMNSSWSLLPKRAKLEGHQLSYNSKMTIGDLYPTLSSVESECPFTQQPGSDLRKSLNDTRQYRIITLTNSLKVLLISDLKPGEEPAAFPAEDDSDVEEEEEDSGSEGNESDIGSEEEDDDNSEGEDGEDNGPISPQAKHKGEKLSAAALCIGVGSFSDPPDVPGLAHFLEHMVFMGSEKYPDENAFDAFIKKHGGNDNAYTDCERTVFYFDIQRKNFQHALDIFAQFFTSPLMKQCAVDREIKAVDSEFDMNLNSDSARKEQLLGSFAHTGHPMGKFMWGNTQSLKTDTASQGIDIYSRLQDFYKKHYSANIMTLAVQSKDSLDTLEEWVSDIFSKIPNNALSKEEFYDLRDPFETEMFRKLYKVIPVKNLDHIEITWALPPLGKHYRAKPLNYISWLLGHEEKGSVISYLKKKLWALSITSGNGDSGFEFNSTYSSFSISITLTEEGFRHIPEVLTVVFDYLTMLRREGPCYRGYREIQTIENNDFRWQEQSEPVDYVEKLCENMQLYPPGDYLIGDSLLLDYDPQIIEQCQNLMTPERANIMVFSKKYEDMGICKKKEKWFKTSYCVEDIPEEWMQAWKSPELGNNPELHLPKENEFIATDFRLKEPDMASLPEFPVAILDNEQSKIWYKKDTQFCVPKAYIYFHLMSPIAGQSPQSMVLMDLMVQLLQHKLAEEIYSADLAQLSCAAKVLESGLELQFSGFNHKLPVLIQKVINAIADFNPTEDLFSTVKEQTKKMYYNTCIKPDRVVREVRLTILQDRFWPSTDKHFVVDALTFDMLMTFVNQFRTHLFIEGMVHGNMTVQEALDLEDYMCKQLKCATLPKSTLPKTRVHELPVKNSYCRVKTFNPSDCNSVVTNYYQCGPGMLHEAALNELVIMRMEEPCFDILRTREQLGYSVFCTHRDTYGVLGMSVTVCTQANKFKTQHVDEHIEMFLKEFDEMMKHMTEEEFASLVNALITTKMCEDSHMGDEAERNWGQIVFQHYMFDRRQQTISKLEKLTLQEFRSWFSQNALGHGRKKLSVQVIGQESKEDLGTCSMEVTVDSTDLHMTELTDTSRKEYATLNPDICRRVAERCSDVRKGNKLQYQMVTDDQCGQDVTDITEFKDSLPLFPVCKVPV